MIFISFLHLFVLKTEHEVSPLLNKWIFKNAKYGVVLTQMITPHSKILFICGSAVVINHESNCFGQLIS